MNEIVRASIQSSCIASVGYSGATKTLEVEFSSGAVYRYFEVSYETHGAFMSAASKGSDFNRQLLQHPAHARPNLQCIQFRLAQTHLGSQPVLLGLLDRQLRRDRVLGERKTLLFNCILNGRLLRGYA